MKYSFWLFFVLLTGNTALNAQVSTIGNIPNEFSLSPGNETINQSDATLFVIRNIYITGNKKTRRDIILRELPFKAGDHYLLQDIVAKFQQAREQLLNTSLFHDVVVALKSFEGYNVDVQIEVKERWYLFPIPYFKPVDRNFNEWLVEQKGSLARVNYGLKILYNNTTGRNDKFRLWFISGYTHQFSFSYDRLYIDKALKWGMEVNFGVGKTKEVNYNTIGNEQVFVKDSNLFLQNFLDANVELTYRRAIKTRHRFGIGYHIQNVKDTIAKLNPTYFYAGRTQVSYPELYYTMSYFDVDYIPYPTKGYAAELNFSKKGFTNTINSWQLSVKGSANWHLSPRTYLNLQSFSTIKLPFEQPYFNQRLLGYGDVFMQGYEYYVIDGVAGGYLKAGITKEVLSVSRNFFTKKSQEPLRIPLRIFAKVYGNAGYVYNSQPGNNFLVNRMLYSAGFGIDILTYYDFTIKLEYSFNQLGENGLFLHRMSNF